MALLEALQHEGAEQDLAAGIVGAFLLADASLESGTLRIELGEALFDGFACHRSGLRLHTALDAFNQEGQEEPQAAMLDPEFLLRIDGGFHILPFSQKFGLGRRISIEDGEIDIVAELGLEVGEDGSVLDDPADLVDRQSVIASGVDDAVQVKRHKCQISQAHVITFDDDITATIAKPKLGSTLRLATREAVYLMGEGAERMSLEGRKYG